MSKELRTMAQNNAQWLWFSEIANVLNEENVTIEQVLRPDIHWNKDKVKHMFFDPLVNAIYHKRSTTKLNTDEYELLIVTMTKVFGERGIQLPDFPHQEENK